MTDTFQPIGPYNVYPDGRITTKAGDDIIGGLDLCHHHIGNKGVQDIAKALKNNTSITTLNLGCNDISLEGLQALAAVL